MGRHIKIDDAFWKEDFLKLSKKHKKIQTKLLCLHHIQKRKGYKIIAELFGVSEKYVQILLNKYAKDGIDGILPKVRKPREDKITNSFDILAFKAVFLKEQETKEGGRLTGKDAKRIIEEKFNCSIGLSTTYRVLHEINLSYITGRDINPATNEEEQIAFKKNLKKM
jgi:transposase